MVSVLTQIMSLLVGGITQVAEGIGGGLKALVENIFINVTETSGGATTYELTTFGVYNATIHTYIHFIEVLL